jgi:hypothetical protein
LPLAFAGLSQPKDAALGDERGRPLSIDRRVQFGGRSESGLRLGAIDCEEAIAVRQGIVGHDELGPPARRHSSVAHGDFTDTTRLTVGKGTEQGLPTCGPLRRLLGAHEHHAGKHGKEHSNRKQDQGYMRAHTVDDSHGRRCQLIVFKLAERGPSWERHANEISCFCCNARGKAPAGEPNNRRVFRGSVKASQCGGSAEWVSSQPVSAMLVHSHGLKFPTIPPRHYRVSSF